MDEKEWYAAMIEQARNGDRESGIGLLSDFVALGKEQDASPLVAYVATCIAEWLASDCSPQLAAKAFNVPKPSHRSPSKAIIRKHLKALRAYYLMRGRGVGYEAAKAIAASTAKLSLSAINKLLEQPRDEDGFPLGGLTLEQAAALYAIENKRVRERCLNPPRKSYQRTR